jgi:hypothetical protein
MNMTGHTKNSINKMVQKVYIFLLLNNIRYISVLIFELDASPLVILLEGFS